jgi:hypothetical protein
MRHLLALLLSLFISHASAASCISAQQQNVLVIGAPQYACMGISGTTNETAARIIIPASGSITALRVRAASSLALLSSVTITVFLNGSATATTCTVTPADGTNQVVDLSHPFLVAGGDTLSFQFASAGLNVANTISASVAY